MTFIINKQAAIRRCKKYFRKSFNFDVLKRRLPILEWLPKYNLGTLIQDVIAGLTVGLTAVPQGIAYAVIAGLPPEYGLYSSLTAGTVYAFFGSSKDISVGATAILSAITAKYVSSYSADFAVLAAFLSGVLIVSMAVLRLGFLVEFISLPVISGFTTAAALQISASQLKALFGLNGSSGNYFADSVYNFVCNIKTINIWDSILGFCTIILLLLMKKLGQGCTRSDQCLKKCRWFISLARNTIVVAIGMTLAYILKRFVDSVPLTLIGEINGGLPHFGLPPFRTVINNETHSFYDMLEILGAQSLVIPLIAVLEIIVISKAFSDGGQIDVTQQILALGLCNIVGSFGKSMPVTGAFSRTALNYQSGVQTTFAGVLTSVIITLSLTLLTSAFSFIPKASLAGLIITAVFTMIDLATIQCLWRVSKRELSILFVTMVTSLFFGLEFGIISGVLAEAFVVIFKQSKPNINVNLVKYEQKILVVIDFSQTILYCSAEHLKRELIELTNQYNDSVIVINGINVKYLDFTVASNLMSFVRNEQEKSRQVVFINFNSSVTNMCVDIFPDFIDNVIDCKNYVDTEAILRNICV